MPMVRRSTERYLLEKREVLDTQRESNKEREIDKENLICRENGSQFKERNIARG